MRIPLSLAARALALGLASPAFAQAGGPETRPPPNPGSAGGGSSIAGGQAAADLALVTAGLAQAAASSGSTGHEVSGASDRTVSQPSPSATGTTR